MADIISTLENRDGDILYPIAGGAANGSITTAMIMDNAISTAKIANSAVTTAKIADGNVTTAKIADNAVTTGKIADLNITTAKLANSAVTSAKIADLNVTTAKLANNSVTSAKMNPTVSNVSITFTRSTGSTQTATKTGRRIALGGGVYIMTFNDSTGLTTSGTGDTLTQIHINYPDFTAIYSGSLMISVSSTPNSNCRYNHFGTTQTDTYIYSAQSGQTINASMILIGTMSS